MFNIIVGQYVVTCQSPELPRLYTDFVSRAKLAEEFDLSNPEGNSAFIAVTKSGEGLSLVVAWRCVPGEISGFYPEALIVPETDILFLGGGERILAYDLTGPSRLWEDVAYPGFWGWQRHGDFVIMSAEMEITAWDIHAKKLWSTWVEPPWDYSVEDGYVNLDVMSKKSRFPIAEGP